MVQPLVVPQKIKNKIPTKSSNSTFGAISHKIKSRVSKRNLYTLFTAALFTTVKMQTKPEYPQTNG